MKRNYDISLNEDIDILRFNDENYLFSVYNDKGERMYVKSMRLQTLSRIAKLLTAYVRSEKEWQEGGAR